MASRWRDAITSVVKGIGSLGNKPEKRLSECLPPADRPITDSQGQLKHYNGWHVFASPNARDNFIKTVLIILSDNGTHEVSNLSFDTFYNRSYDGEGNIWYSASIVAMDDLNIRHAIMATSAGTTKASAFRLLMLDIEIRMGALLRDSSGNAGITGFGAPTLQLSPTAFQAQDEKEQMPVVETNVHTNRSSSSEQSGQSPNPAANSSVRGSVHDLKRSFTLRY